MEGTPLPTDVLSDGLWRLCQNDPHIDRLIAPRFSEIYTSLAVYIEQIELHNPAWSLVSTNDRKELIIRHILDSLAPLGIISCYLADDGSARAADVGSGAGLPGFPLAIALPHVQFTLIERGGRRANFLRITQETLGLANTAVEEAEMEKVKPDRFNVVTLRAFRPLEPKIFKKILRLCFKGGVLAAYKGRREKINMEMTSLEDALPDVADQWEILPCPVPMLEEERHLVVIRRWKK